MTSAETNASVVRELPGGTVLCRQSHVEMLGPQWFDREFWQARGARRHTTTGRSPVLILDQGRETWVLRHYRRGGAVSRFVDDHYIYAGLERARSFKEWRLLSQMSGWGLPVPEGIAACVKRRGWLYQADIITRFLPDTHPLSSALNGEGVSDESWRAIGRMIRGFHARGVDHPDLTAHNVLLDGSGRVFLVDFDNAKVRPPGRWTRRGLARFERSLRKVALETGTLFGAAAWQVAVDAYFAADQR